MQVVIGLEAADEKNALSIATSSRPTSLSQQVRGEKLDARTDLFSFGLVLYEMATGQRTFSGDTVPAIHDAVLHQFAVPARQVRPDLPVDLEGIITKAIEKDRELRYQTATQLRDDLQRLSMPVDSIVPPART
jgi:serine/threonine protein kinase